MNHINEEFNTPEFIDQIIGAQIKLSECVSNIRRVFVNQSYFPESFKPILINNLMNAIMDMMCILPLEGDPPGGSEMLHELIKSEEQRHMVMNIIALGRDMGVSGDLKSIEVVNDIGRSIIHDVSQ